MVFKKKSGSKGIAKNPFIHQRFTEKEWRRFRKRKLCWGKRVLAFTLQESEGDREGKKKRKKHTVRKLDLRRSRGKGISKKKSR